MPSKKYLKEMLNNKEATSPVESSYELYKQLSGINFQQWRRSQWNALREQCTETLILDHKKDSKMKYLTLKKQHLQ